MKKSTVLLLIIVLALVCCAMMVACEQPTDQPTDEPTVTYRTVTFDPNYEGSQTTTVSVVHGEIVPKPEDLSRDGYKFLGWFVDEACQIKESWIGGGSFSPYKGITADTTFYAGWEKIVVAPTLVRIEATYRGDALVVGGSLAKADVSVTGYYSDDTSKPITAFSLGAIDTTTAGTKTVEVTYQDKTATITVTVEEEKVPCVECVDADTDGVCDVCGGEVALPEGPVLVAIDGYMILGVNGVWDKGLKMQTNPANPNEVMYLGFEANGTDGIKIYYCNNDGDVGNDYHNWIKDGVTVSYTYSNPDGNIILAAGTYDFYYDTVSGQLWIQLSN